MTVDLPFAESVDEIRLRPYQDDSVEGLRGNIRAGLKNQVLCSPTGSGKTVIAAHLLKECHEKGKRAVMVVDRISLINQTSAMLDKHGIPHGVIQADHARTNYEHNIQVASAQTLQRRQWPAADLIIVDECHSIMATTIKRIGRRDCVTIGLSATPFTSGLAKHYDAVVTVTTANKLTQEGYLVPFKIFAASEPDMTGAKVVAGEWTDFEASQRAMPIIGDAVAEYLKHGNGEKFIAFGCDVNHCEELRRQFLAAGVNTALYTYRTDDIEREQIVTEFRKPDSTIRGLISVSAISKGFDVPDVGVIIMCRPLRKSLTEFIQTLGRGLRPSPGKEFCTVLDHSGNTLRFWDDMHEFFEHSIHELDDGSKKKNAKKKDKEKKPRKCPKCHHVHDPRPACPACGFEYPSKKPVEHRHGELREIGNGTSRTSDRQSWYSQLIALGIERNKKANWPDVMFKLKFGFWPRGLHDEPMTPTLEVKNYVRSRMIAWIKGRERQKATA